jgi:hypothetical protein
MSFSSILLTYSWSITLLNISSLEHPDLLFGQTPQIPYLFLPGLTYYGSYYNY